MSEVSTVELAGTNDWRGVGPAVDDLHAGARVDLYLAKLFPFRSRGEWARACRDAALRVNGDAVKPSYRLRCGDRVERFHPLDEEPSVDLQLHAVYRDAGILAVAKPGNLPMHEGGRYRRNTFAHALHEQFGPQWAAVHRLDRETSGIVLCAADPLLRAALAELFVFHRVQKEYLAIAAGVAPAEEWTAEQPVLSRQEGARARLARTEGVARPARTDIRVDDRAGDYLLLRCLPRTGRLHQIRVHLAAYGLPLLGDTLYGGRRDLPGVGRHFLHAARLTLKDPRTGEPLRLVCPPPHDMRAFWSQAVRDALR